MVVHTHPLWMIAAGIGLLWQEVNPWILLALVIAFASGTLLQPLTVPVVCKISAAVLFFLRQAGFVLLLVARGIRAVLLGILSPLFRLIEWTLKLTILLVVATAVVRVVFGTSWETLRQPGSWGLDEWAWGGVNRVTETCTAYASHLSTSSFPGTLWAWRVVEPVPPVAVAP